MKKILITLCLISLIGGCGQFLSPELQAARENVAKNSNDEMKNHISRGAIVIGMNKDEVLTSWGSPGLWGDVNKSIGSWGVHEQWVYRSSPSYPASAYLYFENGILTSYQD